MEEEEMVGHAKVQDDMTCLSQDRKFVEEK